MVGTASRRASSSRAAVNGSGGGARQPGQRHSVAASQADDGVEADRSASLELGYLGIGDPHHLPQLALGQTDQAAKGTLHGDGGPAPQLRRQGVPEHLGHRVIASRAQRLAKPWVVLVMAMPAAIPQTVRAGDTLAVGPTGQHQASLSLASVDSAEAGRGEGHEQPRMPGHRLRDALATA